MTRNGSPGPYGSLDGEGQLGELVRKKDGAEIALMTDGVDGAQPMAMGSAGGVLFLTDEKSRVYTYAGEAYVTAALLEQLGVKVLLVSGTPVIH